MAMWRMKSCPRCRRGDTYIYKDDDKWFEQCLQCAYRRELKPLSTAKGKQPVPDREESEMKKAS